MLCEAAAAAAAEFAVPDGWVALAGEAEAAWVVLEVEAAATALMAAVRFTVAPPWGATTAESLNFERPSWTVIRIRSAEIVVPAVAISVSQSSGSVRVYQNGKTVLELQQVSRRS